MADVSTGDNRGFRHLEVDLAGALRAIWRRRAPLLSFVLAATVATAVVLTTMTPRYTAETLISVEPRMKLLQLVSGSEPHLSDVTYIDTQVEVLRSPALARRVIDRLHLEQDPEFNPVLITETSPLAQMPGRLRDFVNYLWDSVRAAVPHSGEDAEMSASGSESGVLARFLSKLSVAPRGTSYVILVTFSSNDPRKSAAVANELANEYLESQAERKLEASQHASEWLRGRLQELRKDLIEAEEAVGQFRDREGFTKGTQGSVTEQQISEINARLVAAEADYSRAAARLHAAQQSAVNVDRVDGAPEVLSSPVILALRSEEAKLITRLASVSEVYGQSHPKIAEVQAQLRELRQSMRTEAQKIVSNLALEARVSRDRITNITQMLDNLRNHNSTRNQAEVHLRELEREADARRQSYMSLLARQQEISAQESFQVPDAVIIGKAQISLQPSFPRIKLVTAAGGFISLLLGALIILLIEGHRKGVFSKEQIEWVSGLPVLSIVPSVRKRLTGGLPALASALDGEGSLRQGAARALFAAMSSGPRGAGANALVEDCGRAKVILVTSALPGEGKSTCAAAIALKAAQAGKKCVVLDCDFRRRGLEELFGEPNREGLLQVLSGERMLQDVTCKFDPSGLHFISSGATAGIYGSDHRRRRAVNDQLPFLFGPPMQRLVDSLRGEFDLVVIDTPPVMATDDGLALSQIADETMLIVQWRETRVDVVLAAMRQLRASGANVRGVVLSQVDARQYAKYGFVDSNFASRRFRQYY
jgi:capsular exopolysaccharide synthesis family protein